MLRVSGHGRSPLLIGLCWSELSVAWKVLDILFQQLFWGFPSTWCFCMSPLFLDFPPGSYFGYITCPLAFKHLQTSLPCPKDKPCKSRHATHYVGLPKGLAALSGKLKASLPSPRLLYIPWNFSSEFFKRHWFKYPILQKQLINFISHLILVQLLT